MLHNLRTIFSRCNCAHEYSENISTMKILHLWYALLHVRGEGVVWGREEGVNAQRARQ